jgi:hypothetical protein
MPNKNAQRRGPVALMTRGREAEPRDKEIRTMWMFVERPWAAQPTGMTKRALDSVLAVKAAVDKPWFGANRERRLRARPATLGEFEALRALFKREILNAERDFTVVAIVARCGHDTSGVARVGAVQYVSAKTKVAERLAGMSDADILSGYAPGIPSIIECMSCRVCSYVCRSDFRIEP